MKSFISGSISALALLAISAEAQNVMERSQPWPIPARIDVTTQKAPDPVPVQRKWTVAMWDFPSFQLDTLISAPWRTPLLYESGSQGIEVNGIRVYRKDDPRVVDWHVHWMTKYGINLILWDWYPRKTSEGKLDCSDPINNTLDMAFLGKAKTGGEPVATNRFAKAIDFAVMVTDHGPVASPDLPAYMINNFFKQPNYYKIDGKPLVIFWDTQELARELGGVPQAHQYLDDFRDAARKAGFPDLFLVTIVGNTGMPGDFHVRQTKEEGFDGGIGYHYSFAYGGEKHEELDQNGVKHAYFYQDYLAKVIPGHQKVWDFLTKSFGNDYLLSITCDQDWRGGRPGGPVTVGKPADLTKIIEAGIQTIKERKLRPFISLEAWNEFGEGAVMEPCIDQGYRSLEAMRDGLHGITDNQTIAAAKINAAHLPEIKH